MTVRLYGTDRRTVACKDALLRSVKDTGGIIHLLPIPSVHKNSEKSNRMLRELQSKVGKNDTVAGYGIPPEWAENLTRMGCCVLDTSKDQTFLYENAALTADGALAVLLARRGCAPCDVRYGIVGYGRIGKALLTRLLFLGATCTVYTTSPATRRTLGESGIDTVLLLPPGERTPLPAQKTDVLLNTAPAKLFGKADVAALGGAQIYELASGDNFPPDTPLVRLSSLPARFYPETAGRLYAEAILRMRREVTA